jgi:uncharacterized damage-inducible protein DinB
MDQNQLPEVWLRGPVTGIIPVLQPVVHALLQAKEEVNKLLKDFPDQLLWDKPAGVASVAFHLLHLAGVLDRLFTYAKELPLSESQLEYLKNEGIEQAGISSQELLDRFNVQVESAIEQLRNTGENTVFDYRPVGRAKLPSTVVGLLFHAAEHTQRHTGQLLVTVKVLKEYGMS